MQGADYAGLVDRWNLGQRVHFHGPSDDITEFYAAADLLVLPTEYEPFGLVIIEALATGLPVITTRVAGAARYVTPEVGRLQDRAGDADELARLLKIGIDDDVRAQWAAAAPDAATPCRWQAVLPRVEEIIERLARG